MYIPNYYTAASGAPYTTASAMYNFPSSSPYRGSNGSAASLTSASTTTATTTAMNSGSQMAVVAGMQPSQLAAVGDAIPTTMFGHYYSAMATPLMATGMPHPAHLYPTVMAAAAVASTGPTMGGSAPNPSTTATNALLGSGQYPSTSYYPTTTTIISSSTTAAVAASSNVPGEGPAQHRKLFIGGLSHETSDEQLRDYYAQWGHVVDSIVIRDPVTKHSRGFGFVTYHSVAQADAAMADRPHTISGKVVDPKRAIPREQMLTMGAGQPTPNFLDASLDGGVGEGCRLTLHGIHWDFHTVDGLRIYFERFGEVEQVEIVGQPRGYGFIVFEDRHSAERCVASGISHLINGKAVEVKDGPNEHPATSKSHGMDKSTSLASHDSRDCTPESSINSSNEGDAVVAGGGVGHGGLSECSFLSSFGSPLFSPPLQQPIQGGGYLAEAVPVAEEVTCEQEELERGGSANAKEGPAAGEVRKEVS